MILSRRVSLGGVQLDEIHESVVIRSFDPGTASENITAVDRMGGSGQRITGRHRSTLEATLVFAINIPKRELALRRQVFEAVTAWALKKGWLKVNYLDNRRMYVDAVVIPSGGDMWEWTGEYTITFKAYNVPFWQDELPAQAVSGQASSGTVYVDVGGNVQSVMDASFRNRSGMTINSLAVTAGGNRIQLSNLGLGGSGTLAISHGTDGLLRIKIGSTSVYEKYTGADDLYVNPGRVAVSWTADRAGILTAQSFGRWI